MQTTFLDQCEQALARHARLWVYTLLSGPHRGATCVAAPEPLQQADAAFNPFLTQPRPQQGAVLLEDGQGGACFVQCFGVQPQLVICGAGHISQPLCQVAKLLDFAVTVIDDRADLPTERGLPRRIRSLPCRLRRRLRRCACIYIPIA